MITQTYRVNMVPGRVPAHVHVSQYDAQSRNLILYMYQDETAYTPPAGSTATLEGTRPDGLGFAVEGSVSGNAATFEVADVMTACWGECPCQITVKNSGAVLGSQNFMLDVEKGPLQEETPMAITGMPGIVGVASAMVTLSAITPGLTMPGTVAVGADALSAALERAEEIRQLTIKGVPVFTPAPPTLARDNQAEMRIADVEQSGSDVILRFSPMAYGGKIYAPVISIDKEESVATQSDLQNLPTAEDGYIVFTAAELETLGVHLAAVKSIHFNGSKDVQCSVDGTQLAPSWTGSNGRKWEPEDPDMSEIERMIFSWAGSLHTAFGTYMQIISGDGTGTVEAALEEIETLPTVSSEEDGAVIQAFDGIWGAGLKFWTGTQTEYDDLSEIDSGTVYLITEDTEEGEGV